MGQSQTQLKQNEDYRLIEELAVGNIVKHNKTESLHFLKQYSFTAQQAYQNALNSHSLRLANKNEHILNFLHFTTKSENSFCSSFHKIILIFQYSDYSLEKEIANRARDGHPFSEKEVWSILCSCVLAAVHLIHCEGRMHCGLTSKDVRLSSNGCVKLLSHEMIGIDTHHNQNEGLPKSLAVTLLECINLQKVTNEDSEYLKKAVEMLDYSRDMKEMLYQMLKKDSTFLELEEHLYKLVQDDESLATHSNTPILKTQSPLVNSGYKCPRIGQNNKGRTQIMSGKKESKFQILSCDSEDHKSYLFQFEETNYEIENPDQTEEEQHSQQNIDDDEPQQINCFLLKEKKNESNLKSMKIDAKAMEKDISRKDYEINRVQSSRRKQNIENTPEITMKTAYEVSSAQNAQSIFTDPKLISLIKSDLEQIKMKRSIGQLTKFQKTQELKNISNQEPNTIKSEFDKLGIPNQQRSQQKSVSVTKSFAQSRANETQAESWFRQPHKASLSNRIQPESMKSEFKQIQMIREVSQQYRQEQQDKRDRKSIKGTQKQKDEKLKSQKLKPEFGRKGENEQKLDNIMNEEGVGFRKKKQSTAKFQIPKENGRKSEEESQSCLNYRPKQNPELYRYEQKSKTVDMKPQQSEKNLNSIRQEDFFNEHSQSHSSQSSSRVSSDRNQKQEKEKLVQVSEKYTRGQYEGTKLNGKRHGFGTFFYSEGGKYVGNWRENKMHGKGVLYYPSQKVAYDGEWENDQLSGYGVLYNEEVATLRTPFDYRDWSDVQDFWVKYEGHFYQDNKEGHGKLYLVNGERLEGEFHDDKVDGEGILFRGDGTSVRGKWRQNKLIRMF